MLQTRDCAEYWSSRIYVRLSIWNWILFHYTYFTFHVSLKCDVVLDKTEGNDASESIVILASPNLEDKDDTDHFGTSQDEDIFDLQVGSCCSCIDYSVLMYRDDIQLMYGKECFWYELHALTSNRYSALDVKPVFPLELTHFYLTLAWVWQVSYFNPMNGTLQLGVGGVQTITSMWCSE